MTNQLFECLERRRLLSLALLGPASPVPAAGNASRFDAAVAGNGASIVAFVTADTGDLQAIRYSADGAPLGSVATFASGKSITGVSTSMDADGNAVVAWAETDSSSSQSIHFQRISNTGIAAAPVTVATDRYVFSPTVSLTPAGKFFMGWVQTNQDVAGEKLRIEAFNAAGTPLAQPFTVMDTGGDIDISLGTFTLAAKPDGSGAVFTISESFEGADDNIAFGQTSASALLGSLSSVSSLLGEDDPSIAINADGSFEIGYTTSESVGGVGGDAVSLSVILQRFNASGDELGDVITLRPSSEDVNIPQDIFHTVNGFVDLVANPAGGFVAAYSRSVATGTDASTTPVFVQSFDAQGVADPAGPFAVATNAVNERIRIDNSGNGIAVYSSLDGSTPLRVTRFSLTTDFATIQNGQLAITGTAGDDTISIAVDGSNLIVTRGTETRTFSTADVGSIRVDGFDGNDTITNGTLLPSTLEGGEGDDTIFGGDGADRIDGGAGSDSLWGGDSNDRLAGDDGHDYLYGNGGNDRLYGGLQPDFIRGNGGRDRLYGNGGNDRLYGGASSDSLYGQGGNDQLNGEGGNDRLYADYASGSSTLHGNAGNDTLITKNNLVDNLFGDGGHDSATADTLDTLTSIESQSIN